MMCPFVKKNSSSIHIENEFIQGHNDFIEPYDMIVEHVVYIVAPHWTSCLFCLTCSHQSFCIRFFARLRSKAELSKDQGETQTKRK